MEECLETRGHALVARAGVGSSTRGRGSRSLLLPRGSRGRQSEGRERCRTKGTVPESPGRRFPSMAFATSFAASSLEALAPAGNGEGIS